MKKKIRSTMLRRAPLASLIAAILAAPPAVLAQQATLTFADAATPAPERVPGERRPAAFDPAAVKEPGSVAPQGAPPSTILFSVNFDADCSQNPPAPPPSPPAPYATPLGFTVINVDGLTPAGGVSYVNNAWIVREDFRDNVADCAMFSTSWYSPAGTANDWAVFPASAAAPLTPTANTQLRWNAVTYDPSYPDGYEVRYSTGGTAPADFLANPPLFATAAENTSWTARSLTLPAALAGTPVRLAFRNNSVDKFLLLVDDIVVENIVNFDPVLGAITDGAGTAQYARVPAFLQYPFDLEASVSNAGVSALTGVSADVDVLVAAAPAANFTSAPIPLAAGASATVALGTGAYATPGAWTAEGLVSAAEGDQNPANSALAVPLLEVTASELTRAEGPATGSLGIGAGNGGELGVDFELPAAARLASIRIAYNNNDTLPDNPDPAADGDGVGDMNGRQMQAVVRAWDTVNAVPGDLLFTATATVAADAPIGALTLDFPVTGTVLPAGRYLVAAVEPNDLTLGVQMSDARFTLGTTWVNWPTSPLGGWGNNEDFGAGFAKMFRISAFLAPPAPLPVAADDAETLAEDDSVTGNVGSNDLPSDQGGSVWAQDQGPSNGVLQFAADGAYTYTPNANFNGSDSFTYTLCDADNDCDSATVTLTVTAVDDAPVAADDSVVVAEDGSVSGSVAGNDTPSGDGGNVWTLDQGPANGVLQFAAGSGTYTPTANFNGTDSFTYTLCDVDGDCDSATVTLTVTPVDDLPVASDDAFTVGPVQPLAGSVAANDTAGDGASVFSVIVPPASGSFAFQPDGSFTYTSAAGISGVVSFTYQICDADADCDPAQVAIDVLPVRIFQHGFED
jgi:hypothetical protein